MSSPRQPALIEEYFTEASTFPVNNKTANESAAWVNSLLSSLATSTADKLSLIGATANTIKLTLTLKDRNNDVSFSAIRMESLNKYALGAVQSYMPPSVTILAIDKLDSESEEKFFCMLKHFFHNKNARTFYVMIGLAISDNTRRLVETYNKIYGTKRYAIAAGMLTSSNTFSSSNTVANPVPAQPSSVQTDTMLQRAKDFKKLTDLYYTEKKENEVMFDTFLIVNSFRAIKQTRLLDAREQQNLLTAIQKLIALHEESIAWKNKYIASAMSNPSDENERLKKIAEECRQYFRSRKAGYHNPSLISTELKVFLSTVTVISVIGASALDSSLLANLQLLESKLAELIISYQAITTAFSRIPPATLVLIMQNRELMNEMEKLKNEYQTLSNLSMSAYSQNSSSIIESSRYFMFAPPITSSAMQSSSHLNQAEPTTAKGFK